MQIKPSHVGTGHPAIILQTAKKYLGRGGRATVFYFAENFLRSLGWGWRIVDYSTEKRREDVVELNFPYIVLFREFHKCYLKFSE